LRVQHAWRDLQQCFDGRQLNLSCASPPAALSNHGTALSSAAGAAAAAAVQVRAFLKAPARSMKGLPRRPVVGTAISIRLDLDKAQISEWFGQGYD